MSEQCGHFSDCPPDSIFSEKVLKGCINYGNSPGGRLALCKDYISPGDPKQSVVPPGGQILLSASTNAGLFIHPYLKNRCRYIDIC